MEVIYCAVCKHGRKAYTKKGISFINYFYGLSLSVLIMLIIFQSFHPSVFFVLLFILVAQELFITLRRRVSIQCDMCGFDPILYVKSPKIAIEKVNEELRAKKGSIDHLLKGHNPFEHLGSLDNKTSQKTKLKDSPRL